MIIFFKYRRKRAGPGKSAAGGNGLNGVVCIDQINDGVIETHVIDICGQRYPHGFSKNEDR